MEENSQTLLSNVTQWKAAFSISAAAVNVIYFLNRAITLKGQSARGANIAE